MREDRETSKVDEPVGEVSKNNLVSQWSIAYDTLSNIQLPLKMTTSMWHKSYILQLYKRLGRNDIPNGYPVGIISNGLDKHILIVLDGFPVVVSFNDRNRMCDTLFLFHDYGESPRNYVLEYAELRQDLSIQLIDSIYSYQLGKNEEWLSETEKFERIVEDYQIDTTGYIKKLN